MSMQQSRTASVGSFWNVLPTWPGSAMPPPGWAGAPGCGADSHPARHSTAARTRPAIRPLSHLKRFIRDLLTGPQNLQERDEHDRADVDAGHDQGGEHGRKVRAERAAGAR